MTVCFLTLGCKVNQYETEFLARRFAEEGFTVLEGERADVVVLNTCTVTAAADKKGRQLLHRLRRENPQSVIVLCGCYPQAFPEKACVLAQADIVVGNTDRRALPGLVKQALLEKRPVRAVAAHQSGEPFEPMQVGGLDRHTRAFLKIQDGCDRRCTYCIIPKARGRSRSKPPEQIEGEACLLAAHGYREIVLTGINLSSYGKEWGGALSGAVAAASKPEGILRVRLGSLEPDLMSDAEIAALARCEKLCGQFHLSLQSGCDETLRRMGRFYDSAFYESLLCRLRAAFPGCAVTTDVMVGFAGETEEEFETTLQNLRRWKLSQIHLFPYSVRPGTPAARLEQVPGAVKKERMRRAGALAKKLEQAFLQQSVGTIESVLLESTVTPFGRLGHTPTYLPVAVAEGVGERGDVVEVRITSVRGGLAIGEKK